ncbi:hypothetical protein KUBF_48590 [Bacteroides finegoldii]|nr:hypothetical protein KUBF_48590 [Bacteroides finegoldii]
MTGTINANAGTIGGFVIGQGRIGSTATGTGSGGGLAIYDDLFRVGTPFRMSCSAATPYRHPPADHVPPDVL